MSKVWLYITSLIKYQLLILVLALLLIGFLDMIGLIISLLLVLGGFSAAKDDMNKRYAKKQSKKLAVASKYEFEGFEQALFSTQREIKLL